MYNGFDELIHGFVGIYILISMGCIAHKKNSGLSHLWQTLAAGSFMV